MRTLLAAAVAASLTLVPLGAHPAAAEEHETIRLLRSLAFSADCIQMPGRLRVLAERVGPHRHDLTMRGTGLPHGLDHGEIAFTDRSGQYAATFRPDPGSHRVRHTTSADGSFRGDVAASVDDFDNETRCDVGALIVGNPGYGFVRVGNDSVRLTASASQVGVGWVPCRASEPVRGRAVLRFGHATVRTRLDVGECADGQVSLGTTFARDRWPIGTRVVVHSAGRTWHAAYRLRRS